MLIWSFHAFLGFLASFHAFLAFFGLAHRHRDVCAHTARVLYCVSNTRPMHHHRPDLVASSARARAASPGAQSQSIYTLYNIPNPFLGQNGAKIVI